MVIAKVSLPAGAITGTVQARPPETGTHAVEVDEISLYAEALPFTLTPTDEADGETNAGRRSFALEAEAFAIVSETTPADNGPTLAGRCCGVDDPPPEHDASSTRVRKTGAAFRTRTIGPAAADAIEKRFQQLGSPRTPPSIAYIA
jgi:hypothetical protein